MEMIQNKIGDGNKANEYIFIIMHFLYFN
jgi:hypothetical protein